MATVQLKTVKFGGSSLADAAQFQKVKAIIEADPGRRFVVPSAPGKRHAKDTKITDLLYRCQKLAAEGLDFSESLEIIRERYLEIAKSLSIRFDPTEELEKIGAHLKEGATKDYAASRGEYLNGLLLSDYLGFPFVDAAEVVCFNAAGIFQMEETMQKMRKRLSEMECAVIPGFYGAAPDGDIITFSRGGSDITGSLVARAVRAAMYENWTDVSGVLVADPRIVPNAAVINTVTYEELRELSYMGASVLHEDAIFPVRYAGIPINIRNTNDPTAPGTMIVSATSEYDSKHIITGVAGRRGFSVINIEKDMMNSEIGFGRRVLDVLEDNDISFEHLPSGVDTMSVIVSSSSIKEEFKRERILTSINKRVHPDSIVIEDGLALLAVVGRGMVKAKGTAARVFSAISAAGINIRMIDQGSSELNIIIGVEEHDLEKALTAIYHEFVK